MLERVKVCVTAELPGPCAEAILGEAFRRLACHLGAQVLMIETRLIEPAVPADDAEPGREGG